MNISSKESYIDQKLSVLKAGLENFLQSALAEVDSNNPIAEVSFERTKDSVFGDLTLNTAMKYAKFLKTNPLALAEKLKTVLEELDNQNVDRVINKVEVKAPGFINVYLSNNFYGKVLNQALAGTETFGDNKLVEGEKWAVEHTSPNPNKAIHIGHLRNNLVGMSLSNLLESCGATVTKEAIMNDRGIAIAKLMYGYLYGMLIENSEAAKVAADGSAQELIHFWTTNNQLWHTPESKQTAADLFTTQCYIKGEDLMADHEAEIRQLVVDWENGDEENKQLWKHVLNYSYQGMYKTLERLGSSWDKVWYESDHYQEGKDLVEEGLRKGIFQKLEDGAVLTKLESYNIPDTILQKRDGTSLYITQDLALTKKKKLENKVDKLVWVIGPDQSLAMRQVFACCEQLGIGKSGDFWHISYGYVGLADKDGNFTKMSSRKGNVLLIDDLLDTVKEKVRENLKSEEAVEDRAEKLALAAVKFALLKSGKDESLTFDINNSVDVKGDTGIYIMYTLARIHSILEKAGGAPTSISEGPTLDRLIEKTGLPRTLLFYPTAVEKSFADKSTHHVAQYLLELAGAFNNFYEQEKIIDVEDTEKVKLVILQATENTILHALQILNIEPVFKI